MSEAATCCDILLVNPDFRNLSWCTDAPAAATHTSASDRLRTVSTRVLDRWLEPQFKTMLRRRFSCLLWESSSLGAAAATS